MGIATVTVQPTIIPRSVIRCIHCNLNQFEPSSGECRRCKRKLAVEAGTVSLPPRSSPEPSLSRSLAASSNPLYWLPFVLFYVREHKALSQRQVAIRIGLPRTWICKVENAWVEPKIAGVTAFADACEESMERMMLMCERLADAEAGADGC